MATNYDLLLNKMREIGMDYRWAGMFVKKLRDEYGMTVIVSSHILGELEHTADRFGIVNEGVVVKEISQQDLQENQPAVEIAVEDVEKAKRVLEENGIKVLREVAEKSSLEDFYFRLVGGSKQ